MTKKYKKADLDIHTYGRGRNKRFIMYTDFTHESGNGPRWHTQVYPDIEGNKEKATQQALRWLNDPSVHSRFAVYTNNPRKIQIVYDGPARYSETDCDGEPLF